MNPPKALHVPIFLTFLIGGMLVGGTARFFILRESRAFVSRAVVATQERKNAAAPLSHTQAELIKRDLSSALVDPDAEVVRQATKLRTHEDGVEITVSSPDKYSAYLIATEVSRRFRSFSHERKLAAHPVSIGTITPLDRYEQSDFDTVVRLLTEQAEETGVTDFRNAARDAAKGNPAATKLTGDEDFRRRFALYEKFSVRLGLDGIPGEPYSPSLELLVEPEIEDRLVVAPTTELMAMGTFPLGGLLGGALGFWLGRRPPSNRREELRESAPRADAREDDPSEW